MDCREAHQRTSAAALGALEGPELDEFRRHLAACPACHAEFERVRRALDLAAAGTTAGVPEPLLGRVLAAGSAELAAGRSRRRRLRWALALAGAAAALLLALGLAWKAGGGKAPAVCGCWRFVDGDSGNCRRAEAAAEMVPERIAWEQNVPGLAGSLKPLAWKELVIVGAEPERRTHRGGGRLLAFRAADGRVRWERQFPAGDFFKAKGFPDRCIAGGRLYLTDGQACLVLDAFNGRELARYGPPEGANGWSYLTAAGARLYGASRDGRTVFCLEALTGATVWSRPVGGATFIPALAGGRLYLATDAGTLLALDAAGGAEVWRREAAAPVGRASVHAHGAQVLVLAADDQVLAFGAADGAPAWQRRVPGAFASGLAFGSEAVYLLGGAAALALADGAVLWQSASRGLGECAAPTVAGGEVLAAAGPQTGSLSVLAASGRPLGSLAEAARRSCDGAIVSGGRIYTAGGGRLLAVTCRPKG